jgi:hypothetical protein
LRGTLSNRDGVGSRVNVVAGSQRWIDEVHSGRGYQSHWGSRLHYGLGNRARVDRLEIRWLGSGAVEVYEDVAADQRIFIQEGTGIVKRWKLPEK